MAKPRTYLLHPTGPGTVAINPAIHCPQLRQEIINFLATHFSKELWQAQCVRALAAAAAAAVWAPALLLPLLLTAGLLLLLDWETWPQFLTVVCCRAIQSRETYSMPMQLVSQKAWGR